MKLLKVLICMSFLSLPAYAQGDAENVEDFLQSQKIAEPEIKIAPVPEQSEIEKSIAEAIEQNKDRETLKKKIDLAKKMHQIRPTRDQVDSAVNQAAQALQPNERQPFINGMRSILNYNAIERISIDAMVQTYTLVELDSMVAYFSTPEAMSASRKIGVWAQKVQPEVARMIDKAMIRLRTGQ